MSAEADMAGGWSWLPDEHWHPIAKTFERGDPDTSSGLDQYRTLKEWAESGYGVRNVRLERLVGSWEPTE